MNLLNANVILCRLIFVISDNAFSFSNHRLCLMYPKLYTNFLSNKTASFRWIKKQNRRDGSTQLTQYCFILYNISCMDKTNFMFKIGLISTLNKKTQPMQRKSTYKYTNYSRHYSNISKKRNEIGNQLMYQRHRAINYYGIASIEILNNLTCT